jgi:hypothetical protein
MPAGKLVREQRDLRAGKFRDPVADFEAFSEAIVRKLVREIECRAADREWAQFSA